MCVYIQLSVSTMKFDPSYTLTHKVYDLYVFALNLMQCEKIRSVSSLQLNYVFLQPPRYKQSNEEAFRLVW